MLSRKLLLQRLVLPACLLQRHVITRLRSSEAFSDEVCLTPLIRFLIVKPLDEMFIALYGFFKSGRRVHACLALVSESVFEVNSMELERLVCMSKLTKSRLTVKSVLAIIAKAY